jgi:hypothetical protein
MNDQEEYTITHDCKKFADCTLGDVICFTTLVAGGMIESDFPASAAADYLKMLEDKGGDCGDCPMFEKCLLCEMEEPQETESQRTHYMD